MRLIDTMLLNFIYVCAFFKQAYLGTKVDKQAMLTLCSEFQYTHHHHHQSEIRGFIYVSLWYLMLSFFLISYFKGLKSLSVIYPHVIHATFNSKYPRATS